MRRPQPNEHRPGCRRSAFTLVELLIVVAIIGLIISLILVAASDGVRRAEERATQALITKLETGLSDRLDALLNAQAPVNQTHRYLAAINFLVGSNYIPVGSVTSSGSDERRAQVIAQIDYIRSELPDVFFVTGNLAAGSDYTASDYPLNFAGTPYPQGGTSFANYYLPLGNLSPGLPYDINMNLVPNNIQTPHIIYNPYAQPAITGIFGASFSAIGGLTKNLGYTPSGYDGVDNNGNGMIDELSEGTPSGMTAAAFATQVGTQLAKHTHKTARAEMLYAVLVGGVGPLGSAYNPEDFTAREVQDTDGDGLPEFVDAWGEPLQFFRWPIYFGTVAGTSDTQKGSNLYLSYSETRQLDPLDPNQLLVAPGWWAVAGNPALPTPGASQTGGLFPPTFTAPDGNATSAQTGISAQALGFMRSFGSLVDPVRSPTASVSATAGTGWDRTGTYYRRAYFSKFLILSAGPDHEPGVAQFNKDYSTLTDDSAGNSTTPNGTGPLVPFPNTSLTAEMNAELLLMIENQAAQSDPYPRMNTSISGHFYEIPDGATSTTRFLQVSAGVDDISNQNISAPGTGVR